MAARWQENLRKRADGAARAGRNIIPARPSSATGMRPGSKQLDQHGVKSVAADAAARLLMGMNAAPRPMTGLSPANSIPAARALLLASSGEAKLAVNSIRTQIHVHGFLVFRPELLQ